MRPSICSFFHMLFVASSCFYVDAADEATCASTGKRFENKVVLVTGGSSGIGEALAKDLARDGAIVVLGARRVEKMEAIVKEIKASGGQAEAYRLDVTDYESCVQFVSKINETYGRLDGAFNNAGAGDDGASDFVTTSRDKFKHVFDLNFWGTYNMMKAEADLMTQQKKGSIVNNLSLLQYRRFKTAPAYGVAKAAVNVLQEFAAMAVVGTQVRINSVSPGWTLPSEALGSFIDAAPEVKQLILSPQGRMIDASKDVYPALAYLLDDASASVTGVDIPVAGGWQIPELALR